MDLHAARGADDVGHRRMPGHTKADRCGFGIGNQLESDLASYVRRAPRVQVEDCLRDILTALDFPLQEIIQRSGGKVSIETKL
jgi:hypothetical protein